MVVALSQAFNILLVLINNDDVRSCRFGNSIVQTSALLFILLGIFIMVFERKITASKVNFFYQPTII